MDVKAFRTKFGKSESYMNEDMMQNVLAILQTVRRNKDEALIQYTKDFDQHQLNAIKVPEAHLKDSYEQLDEEIKKALQTARERIVAYEESILYENRDLGEFQYVYRPLEKVGVYVPGGTALYPSSVLMTVIPAQVAGVEEIHVTTPTFEKNNITFATLYLLGVKNVYQVGGAQAIAALAYGTETIPKVDKIVGPGNAYVAAAKKLVYGDVGIDGVAGPSEILIFIDETVDVDTVTYDIFAQAEHDPNARTFLLSENQEIVDRVRERMNELIEKQPRKEIIQKSVANHHYAIVDTREKLLEILNEIAAEHVSIQHTDQDEIVDNINFAGAVFKGKYTPEAIGDYIAGPSHVLPTDGTARFTHGLNANDFQTSHAVIALDKETYQDIVNQAMRIADTEQLFAHYDSLRVRKEE